MATARPFSKDYDLLGGGAATFSGATAFCSTAAIVMRSAAAFGRAACRIGGIFSSVSRIIRSFCRFFSCIVSRDFRFRAGAGCQGKATSNSQHRSEFGLLHGIPPHVGRAFLGFARRMTPFVHRPDADPDGPPPRPAIGTGRYAAGKEKMIRMRFNRARTACYRPQMP